MPEVCKTWQCPIEFLLPLCANKLEPIQGHAGCAVCATPYDARLSAPCGCPPPLTSPWRRYTLTATGGASGQMTPTGTGPDFTCPWRAAYGTHTLFGNCGAASMAHAIITQGSGMHGAEACTAYVSCCYAGTQQSMWTVRENYTPFLSGGKWWRHVVVELWDFNGPEGAELQNLAVWGNSTLFPACDNTDHASSTLTLLSVISGHYYTVATLPNYFSVSIST